MSLHKDMAYAFVCGAPRSGTTAFTNMLNSHPKVVIGVERFKFVASDITPHYFSTEHFLAVSRDETNYPWSEGMANAANKLRSGKVAVMGDKVGGYTRRLEHLYESFPSPRITFLLRDPSQVAASFDRRANDPNDRWPQENDAFGSVKFWNRAVREINDYLRRHPSAPVFVIPYSSFFGGDLASLRALVRFLGVPLSPRLVRTFRKYVHEYRQLPRQTADVPIEDFDLDLAAEVCREHRTRNKKLYRFVGLPLRPSKMTL